MVTKRDVTPQSIENRLIQLEGAIDYAYDYAAKQEISYQDAKTAYELAMAASRTTPTESKRGVQEKEDYALLENRSEYEEMMAALGLVKAARGNLERLRIQVDITRSLGATLRSAMEM